jgi:hypothetical protein
MMNAEERKRLEDHLRFLLAQQEKIENYRRDNAASITFVRASLAAEDDDNDPPESINEVQTHSEAQRAR